MYTSQSHASITHHLPVCSRGGTTATQTNSSPPNMAHRPQVRARYVPLVSAPQQRTERQRADPTEIGADAGRMCWLPCQKAREDAHVQIAAFPWAAALRADGPWSGRLVPLTQRRTPRSRCTNVWRKLYPGRYISLIPASHRRHHHIIPPCTLR